LEIDRFIDRRIGCAVEQSAPATAQLLQNPIAPNLVHVPSV
jgi:hypothetical protein